MLKEFLHYAWLAFACGFGGAAGWLLFHGILSLFKRG